MNVLKILQYGCSVLAIGCLVFTYYHMANGKGKQRDETEK